MSNNTPAGSPWGRMTDHVKWSVIIIGLVALFHALKAGATVIVPILFALLLAMLLDPVVERLERKRVPRWLGTLIAVLFAMLVMASLGYFLVTQFMNFSETLPDMEKKMTTLGKEMQRWAQETFNMKPRQVDNAVEKMKNEGMEKGGSLIGKTLTTVGTLFAFFFLLPVFTFLILLYKRLLLATIALLFPTGSHPVVQNALREVRGVVGSYLVGLIAEAGIVTALNWVGLWALGVPYALLLAVVAAVLNLIPYIGMIIATILPAFIALATMEPIFALWVVLLFAAVQFLDNNIIVPRVVGARVQLNALVSLVAVMVGGALWGIPGMFLSLPLAAILKVVFDHSEAMKAFGVLFGVDEPATNRGIFKRKRAAS